MLDQLMTYFANEATRVIDSVIQPLKRKALLFLLKGTLLVLSIAFLSVGVVLFGAQLIGLDLMILLVGAVLFAGFLVIS